MKQQVHLELFTDKHTDALDVLLRNFSLEVFGTGTADVRSFVQAHWCIYLAMIGEQVVGFASFSYNAYFGMRPPTIGYTYLYVLPEFRRSRATYMLAIQSGKLCSENNLALENYYASEESLRIGDKMKGTKLYECYIYEADEVKKKFNRLTKTVKIKE